jgi:fermentation-respiration switch protein FrsA (DUF1100 family)
VGHHGWGGSAGQHRSRHAERFDARHGDTVKIFLIIVLLLYAAFALFAYFASDRMIFQPPRPTYRADQLPIVMIPAEHGNSIATLFLPTPGAALTLVYSHGNAEDIGQLAPYLEGYRQAGFSVLAYDYRGYGASTGGPPSANGATHDLETVIEYATHSLGLTPASIVLLGHSVGSGPSTAVASRVPVGGLVVEAGFVSAFRVLTGVALLPFDKFHNLRDIRHVHCPVLVVHGTNDEVIPFSHGRKLYDAANEPKQSLWIRGAHHNDLVAIGGANYWNTIRAFGGRVAGASQLR